MHALKANSQLNWMDAMTAAAGRRARRVLMPLVALAGASAIAAVKTWSGAGADDNWSTAANWVGGAAPANNDDLVFAGMSRLNPTNDLWGTGGAPRGVNAITFGANAGAFTLSGNPIQPKAGTYFYVYNEGPLAQTIGLDIMANIVAGGLATSWHPKVGDLVLKGAINSSRATDTLIKEAPGTLLLQGPLVFTAAAPGVQVRNGTLVVDLAAGATVTNTTLMTLGNSQTITDARLDEDRQNATLVVRGKPTGTSRIAFSGITVNPEASMARIVVDPNGGAGTTLALGSKWTMAYTMRTSGLHVDLSRPGAEATLANVVYKNNYSIIVPSFTVRDATGTTGFAVTNGLGAIVRNTAATPYAGGATTTGASYIVDGNVAVPGATTFWALTLKNAATLTLGGHAVINGLVMEEGSGDFTVTGGATARLGTASTHTFYIHQHSLAGALVYDCLLVGEFHKLGGGKLIVQRAREDSTNNQGLLYVIEGEAEIQGALSEPTRIHRVFTGATLSGRGEIVSSVTVHPGGTLDGSHVSTNALTIGGNLRLKKGSALSVDIGRATHAALDVAGTVTNEGADLQLALVEQPRTGVPVTLVASDTAISAPFTTVNGAELGPNGAFILDYQGAPFQFVLEQTSTQATATCTSRLPTLISIR